MTMKNAPYVLRKFLLKKQSGFEGLKTTGWNQALCGFGVVYMIE